MKIAITAMGKGLDAEVDPRFGRCQYFIIFDTETGTFEALDNASVSLGGGAGIQSAQTIVEKDAEAVLTGNVGPNAFRTLSAAGISIYAGASGKVSDAIAQFKSGALKPFSAPSVASHYGLGASGSGVTKPSGKKRIAVAAEDEQGLNSGVSQHFGRCPYYTMVEVENGKITLSYRVENPYFGEHGDPGQVPVFIRDQGANVIIAGGMGQRALGFFQQFDIQVVTGVTGQVKTVVEQYLGGETGEASPCAGGVKGR